MKVRSFVVKLSLVELHVTRKLQVRLACLVEPFVRLPPFGLVRSVNIKDLMYLKFLREINLRSIFDWSRHLSAAYALDGF